MSMMGKAFYVKDMNDMGMVTGVYPAGQNLNIPTFGREYLKINFKGFEGLLSRELFNLLFTEQIRKQESKEDLIAENVDLFNKLEDAQLELKELKKSNSAKRIEELEDKLDLVERENLYFSLNAKSKGDLILKANNYGLKINEKSISKEELVNIIVKEAKNEI